MDYEVSHLFSTPVFRFKFKDHEKLKPAFMEYLSQPDVFTNTRPGVRLEFTKPTLHQEPVFEPFVDFVKYAVGCSLDSLGYMPDSQITGIWATRHDEGGFHHRHRHGNAFLAGVYYLDGNEQSSGTTFFSPMRQESIVPARNFDKGTMINNQYTERFQEGTLMVFPAWLEHNTAVNNLRRTNVKRHILSFNAMPLGATNHDEFDRFYYDDVSSMPMIVDRPTRR